MKKDGGDQTNIVPFVSAPHVEIRTRPPRYCRHLATEISSDEPVLTCRSCGAVLDPYAWIRSIIRDWTPMHESYKREAELLKEAIRALRREYKDEAERQKYAREIRIMPPKKSFIDKDP